MAPRGSTKKQKDEDDSKEHFEYLETAHLKLDPENPRLVEFGLGESPSEFEMLKLYWEALAIDELVLSIATNGFYPHEPLFVQQTKSDDYIVLEGNRRLAAVKILLSKQLQERLKVPELPPMTSEIQATLKKLPVVRTSRDSLWLRQVIGFKHVNGPQKWSSYAKAEYIAYTHDKLRVPLEKIAQEIGDRHQTVRRLYRTVTVLNQAERLGVFKRESIYPPRLAFTHLLTGLGYTGFRAFLHITDESLDTKSPIPGGKKKELGEVLLWLYGDSKSKTPPVIVSQNPDLRRLDAVLQSPEATNALRRRSSLVEAFDISKGDESLFEESLLEAKRAITRSSGHLRTGFNALRSDLVQVAREISEIAEELVQRMERQQRTEHARDV